MARVVTTAGFYHCSVKGVGRTDGRSIVAAAAYRSGEQLYDEITGQYADYRARNGVVDKFIITRADAPAWAQDRSQLWNGAERSEKRANGKLATEIELALPHELSAEMRKALVATFARTIVERYGVAADVAIHEPGREGDHRNHHAHILITHRMLDADGFVLIEKGQRRDRGLSKLAEGPKAIVAIRREWEQFVNLAYERAGLDIRVDHRSHEDRKIPQEPTIHLGPVATEIERNGGHSDRGDINRDIEKRNAEREQLAALGIKESEISSEIQAAQAATRTPEPQPPIFDRDRENDEWEQAVAAAAIAAAEKAAEVKRSEDAAKPPGQYSEPPSLIRMYRGIEIGLNDERAGALYFSTEHTRAADFGRVHYVDVTPAEFAKFERAHSARVRAMEPMVANDYITHDADIIARLKPLELEATRKPTQQQQPEAAPIKNPFADLGTSMSAAEAAKDMREIREQNAAEFAAARGAQGRQSEAAPTKDDPFADLGTPVSAAEAAKDMREIREQNAAEFAAARGAQGRQSEAAPTKDDPFADLGTPVSAAEAAKDMRETRGQNAAEFAAARAAHQVQAKIDTALPVSATKVEHTTGVVNINGEGVSSRKQSKIKPWMLEKGGFNALTRKQRKAAKLSYTKWATKNAEAAHRYDLKSYVSFVQDNWERDGRTAENLLARSGRSLAGKTAAAIERETQKTIGTGLRTGARLIGGFLKGIESGLEALFGGGDPVLSEPEAKRTEQAAQERRDENIDGNAAAEREAHKQRLLAQIRRDSEQQRLQARGRGNHDQVDRGHGPELERGPPHA